MFRNLVNLRRASIARGITPLTSRGFRTTSCLQYKREVEEPVGPSIVEKYQLDEPTRYVPITIGTFSLATMTGFYHIDPETQLLALWVLYCGVLYSRAGPALGEFLDGISNEIKEEHDQVEKLEIEAAKSALAAAKSQTVIKSDIQALFDVQTELTKELLGSAENAWKHGVRDGFIRQLDTLVAEQKKFDTEINDTLVQKATESVKKAYLPGGDAALKNSAMDAALAALSNPSTAKKDATVGKLYSKYFNDFSTKVSALSGKEQELSPEMQAALKEKMESFASKEGITGPLPSVTKIAL